MWICVRSKDAQKQLAGLWLAENTRLIYNIIDKINSNNQVGLLVLIDYEKAFDLRQWSLVEFKRQKKYLAPFYKFFSGAERC